MGDKWDDGNKRIQDLMWPLMDAGGVSLSPSSFLNILHAAYNGHLDALECLVSHELSKPQDK